MKYTATMERGKPVRVALYTTASVLWELMANAYARGRVAVLPKKADGRAAQILHRVQTAIYGADDVYPRRGDDAVEDFMRAVAECDGVMLRRAMHSGEGH